MYNSNRQLIIYNNGHAFYHDDMNYVMELQLSDKELRDVLKTFGDANFDSLPSNIALLQLSPCILLACNRLQIVDLSKYGTQAQAVVKSLNSIKQQILNSAVHRLGYARRYQIVEWPYASILELGNRRFEAMSDRNKRLKNLTVPPQLFAAIKQGVAYESADKLYLVSLGNYNGDHPANEPKSLPTWTSFWENEVSPDRVKQFPPETGINLANVPAGGADNGPAGGITLSKTQYDNHRQFFESLPHWPNPGGRQPFWMQNGYLYLGLHIQLENPK